jgi:hypothetical protein
VKSCKEVISKNNQPAPTPKLVSKKRSSNSSTHPKASQLAEQRMDTQDLTEPPTSPAADNDESPPVKRAKNSMEQQKHSGLAERRTDIPDCPLPPDSPVLPTSKNNPADDESPPVNSMERQKHSGLAEQRTDIPDRPAPPDSPVLPTSKNKPADSDEESDESPYVDSMERQELSAEWNRLISRDYKGMEIVLAIDPSWKPGQFMPDEVMYQLWKNKKLNTNILQVFHNEVMPEADRVLKKHFDTETICQIYDSMDSMDTITAGIKIFTRKSEQKNVGKVDKAASVPEKVASHEIYLPSQSDETLSARFRTYLSETLAKNKVTVLRDNTIRQYHNIIFSKTSNHSFSKWVEKRYPGQKLHNLLLSVDKRFITLHDEDVIKFIAPANPGEEGSLTASVSKQCCSAIIDFMTYLICVARRADFEPSDVVASGIQQRYIYRLVTYL